MILAFKKTFFCCAFIGLSFCLTAFGLTTTADAQSIDRYDFTVKVPYKSRSYVGKPLAWDGSELMLLRRDGKISILPVKSTEDYDKVSDSFKPYSTSTVRSKLQKEFGSKYQVSVTRNFIVVHPPGDYQVWAMPFEKLYARFDAYFATRGLSPEEPEFPMVAIVLRTRGEFDKFLRAYHDYDSKILGYYSPRSNRIITYDQRRGSSHDQSWFFNADTIIHEATHQTAFNTGIHSRFAPVPRWISEGLAMLFEAPGVNNSMHYTRQRDRINRERLIDLKRYYQQDRVKGTISKMVASDQIFRSDPTRAYAISWGLTFYLSEKRPEDYLRFLRADGNRSNFAGYSAKERYRAFGREFGTEFSNLEARMERFIVGLNVPSQSR
jgi:hypothetical protein